MTTERQKADHATENPQQPLPTLMRSGFSFLWEVLKTVVISIVIIAAVRGLIAQPFYVKGASMEPTFHDNEYLIINKIDYRLHEPHRGDIVVLRYPRDPSQYFIKRVVGLPGEKIVIRSGSVFIYNTEYPNGWQLDESAYLPASEMTLGDTTAELASNEYFVLGDNRRASLDSRSSILGPVPKAAIVGRTWFRVWPFGKFTMFSEPSYPAS